MKILVCGGREYNSYEYLAGVLDWLASEEGVDCVVHGGARGADSLAEHWAKERNIKTYVYLPDWERFGKSAGIRRNQEMLDQNPDIGCVVAFPGGRGTADMVRRAQNMGIRVHVVPT